MTAEFQASNANLRLKGDLLLKLSSASIDPTQALEGCQAVLGRAAF